MKEFPIGIQREWFFGQHSYWHSKGTTLFVSTGKLLRLVLQLRSQGPSY